MISAPTGTGPPDWFASASAKQLSGLPDAKFVSHSEEHLVVSTARAKDFKVGDALFGIPWHICPTVALYGDAVVVRKGAAAGKWGVARDRFLSL